MNKYIHGLLPAFLVHFSIGNLYSWTHISNKIAAELGCALSEVQWLEAMIIFIMGISAAIGGRASERNVKSATISAAIFFMSGILICALGVYVKSYYLLAFGSGVAGIGLGIGYISPIIKCYAMVS